MMSDDQTPQEQSEAKTDVDLLDQASSFLGDSFEAVLVLATRTNDAGEAVYVKSSHGNHYAHVGLAQEFLLRNEMSERRTLYEGD